MGKRFFTLLAVSVIIMSGCLKRVDPTPEQPPVGSIRYKNTSLSAYYIFLDDKQLDYLSYKSSRTIDSLSVGDHKVKAEQKNGYISYPTVVEQTVTVVQDSTVEFSFP